MGLSIYEIENWRAGQNYNIYDIYRYPENSNTYYYSKQKHNSGLTFDSQFSDGIIEYNGISRPHFFFIPSYNSNIEVRPAIKKIQFGDGFSQRSIDGVNSILLPFSLTFDKRTDAEARAILHFLEMRKGLSFILTPPFPWNIKKVFVCESFRHSQIFANNHSISAEFIETPV